MEALKTPIEGLILKKISHYMDVVFWKEYATLQQETTTLNGNSYFPQRDELTFQLTKLACDPDFQKIYSQVDNLPPSTYAFHGTPHANRVLLMTAAISMQEGRSIEKLGEEFGEQTVKLNPNLQMQLMKDAIQHDLNLATVGYQGHEDPFGPFSMVLATKIIGKVDENKKLVGLHQIVDEPGVYEHGGKLAEVVDYYASQGFEREEVVNAMDIIADVDLLGLGNSYGMVALLLEEFRVHSRYDDTTGELFFKHDRNDKTKAKESIKGSIRGSIMIYESKIRNGFKTELANRMLPKEILEDKKNYVENMLSKIDDWFDDFWDMSEDYRTGKSGITTYGQVFKLVSAIKDAIDKVDYVPVDLSMVPTSVLEVLVGSIKIPSTGDTNDLRNMHTSLMYELILRQNNERSYPEVKSIRRNLDLDYNQLVQVIENIVGVDMQEYDCHRIQRERITAHHLAQISHTNLLPLSGYEGLVENRMRCLNIQDGLTRITGCCASCYYGIRNRAKILDSNGVNHELNAESIAGCGFGLNAIKDEMVEFKQYIEELLGQKRTRKIWQ